MQSCFILLWKSDQVAIIINHRSYHKLVSTGTRIAAKLSQSLKSLSWPGTVSPSFSSSWDKGEGQGR